MAFYDTTWYCNAGDQATTGHYAVTKWAASTAVAAGSLRRQLTTPTVGNERVYVCYSGGTTAATEPTWVVTRGAKILTDNTASWIECTGQAAMNGDSANVPFWNVVKGLAVSQGQIIKRNNGASYQVCTVAGTPSGTTEPAFSDTAGVGVGDGTASWFSLGPVTNFTGGQAPHARLANACAANWFVGGNTIYVGDNHAESQATALSFTATGVSTTSKIIGHNHSGSYPPTSSDLMAGASIATTAGVNITLTMSSFYIYGVTFKCGVGASSGTSSFINSGNQGGHLYFDNCSFWISNTNSGLIQVTQGAANGGNVIWNNCTVRFANVAQNLVPGYGKFTWQNTGPVLVSGSTVPTSLFQLGFSAVSQACSIVLEALDLSQIVNNLYGINSTSQQDDILVKDCKLNAALTLPQPTTPTLLVQFVRSSA